MSLFISARAINHPLTSPAAAAMAVCRNGCSGGALCDDGPHETGLENHLSGKLAAAAVCGCEPASQPGMPGEKWRRL